MDKEAFFYTRYFEKRIFVFTGGRQAGKRFVCGGERSEAQTGRGKQRDCRNSPWQLVKKVPQGTFLTSYAIRNEGQR